MVPQEIHQLPDAIPVGRLRAVAALVEVDGHMGCGRCYLAGVPVLPAPSSAEYASVSRIVEDYLARFGVLHSFGVPEVGENLVASCGTQPEVSLQACKVVAAAGDAILKVMMLKIATSC
jgi:hypothetical protein